MFGTGVSPGISIGKAYLVRRRTGKVTGERLPGEKERRDEAEKFTKAVAAAIREIEELRERDSEKLHKTELDILDTHIEFLNDQQIKTDVLERINVEYMPASDAVIEVTEAAATLFEGMDDEYLRERSADIRDIGNRILRNLGYGKEDDLTNIGDNVILIADDITPSDILSLDLSRISGFATRKGGRTSHSAIIARSRGIPAVAGCGEALIAVNTNDSLIIDGTTGEVIINPDETVETAFRERQSRFVEERQLLKNLRDLPATTTDGVTIRLSGNIGSPSDIDMVFGNGGEGVGLFRTELLFMDRDTLPDEEEQFGFYRESAEKANGRPVIIRTLDIGGDKQLTYLNIQPESNPFMGYRAIRLSLDQKPVFMTQLRAIVRASAYGNLRVMFPMISTLNELRQARAYLKEAREEVIAEGSMVGKHIPVGVMIELPAAALIADKLAREVDFFSIGTNDLCQYTMAVDRMNEKVAYLYNHFDPAVLRLIRYTIEQGKLSNIHVGLCGEMAGDPLATALLVGMGLGDFSMAASSIPSIKNIIRKISRKQAEEIAAKAMELSDAGEITSFLKEIQL